MNQKLRDIIRDAVSTKAQAAVRDAVKDLVDDSEIDFDDVARDVLGRKRRDIVSAIRDEAAAQIESGFDNDDTVQSTVEAYIDDNLDVADVCADAAREYIVAEYCDAIVAAVKREAVTQVTKLAADLQADIEQAARLAVEDEVETLFRNEE